MERLDPLMMIELLLKLSPRFDSGEVTTLLIVSMEGDEGGRFVLDEEGEVILEPDVVTMDTFLNNLEFCNCIKKSEELFGGERDEVG